MSVGAALYVAICIASVAVIGLRLTQWKNHPRTRPLTSALILLLGGLLLRRPEILDDQWLDTHTDRTLHLANWSNVLSDLLLAGAAAYICVQVARVWGNHHWQKPIAVAFVVDAIALIVLWQVSDASRVPTRFIASLGGLSGVYSAVSAATILVANLAVLISLALAKGVPTRAKIALAPMALGGLVGVVNGGLRIACAIDPDRFLSTRNHWAWSLAEVGVALYILSGFVSYLAQSRLPELVEAD
ncbi:hypothetical protein AB0N05_02655 [Nocardia sp. NPDC051030]|uniref:hypothetical protein n=1 Tax=Nocardia sp. NPDC051030 TaxID=3155162 RepID=UPI003434752A